MAATLIASFNAERQNTERFEQRQALDLNTITINKSNVSVASRKTPADITIYICRFVKSDISHSHDYYAYIRTEESVAFVNNSDRTASLTRVDLSAGSPWKVEVFNRSLPADLGANRTEEWRLYGTMTTGHETEALARQAAKELTADLAKFTWKVTFASSTTATLETKPGEPFVFPMVDDCRNLSAFSTL